MKVRTSMLCAGYVIVILNCYGMEATLQSRTYQGPPVPTAIAFTRNNPVLNRALAGAELRYPIQSEFYNDGTAEVVLRFRQPGARIEMQLDSADGHWRVLDYNAALPDSVLRIMVNQPPIPAQPLRAQTQ